jgi:hypothetical protein
MSDTQYTKKLPWPNKTDILIAQNEYAQSRSVWNRVLGRLQENIISVAATVGIIANGNSEIIHDIDNQTTGTRFSGKYIKVSLNGEEYLLPLYKDDSV